MEKMQVILLNDLIPVQLMFLDGITMIVLLLGLEICFLSFFLNSEEREMCDI